MNQIRKRLPLMVLTLFCMLWFTVPAYASVNKDAMSGPGVAPAPAEEESAPDYTPIGTFVTTAYCSCSKCTGGRNRTYAGTVPMSGHTISADLNVFPLGTQLMINDVVYTVEDKGKGVNGNKLDIYFDSHDAALQYGVQNAEVFSVN